MENIELLEQKYLDILRIKNNLINRIDQLEWYILRCGLDLPPSTDDEFAYSNDSAHNRKRVRYSSTTSNWENMAPLAAMKREVFSKENKDEDLHEKTHNVSSLGDIRNQQEPGGSVSVLYNELPKLSDIQAQISAEVENRIAIELGNIQKTTKVTIDEDLDVYKQHVHAQISDAIQSKMEEKFSNKLEEVRSNLKKELQSLAVEQYSQQVLAPKENITSNLVRPKSNCNVTDFESQKQTSDEGIEDTSVSDGTRFIRNQFKQDFNAELIENPLDVQRNKPGHESKNTSFVLKKSSESTNGSAFHEPSLSDNHLSAAEPREQIQREDSTSFDSSRRSQDHDNELSNISKSLSFKPKEYNQRTDIDGYQSKKDNFTDDKQLYHNTAENKELDNASVRKIHSIQSYSTSTPRKSSSPVGSKIGNKGRHPHTSLLPETNIHTVPERNQAEMKRQHLPSSPADTYTENAPEMSFSVDNRKQHTATPPETQNSTNTPPNSYSLDESTSLKKSTKDRDLYSDTGAVKEAFASHSDSERVNFLAEDLNNPGSSVPPKPNRLLSTQDKSLADGPLINGKGNSEPKIIEPIPAVQRKLAPANLADTSSNKSISNTPKRSFSGGVGIKSNPEGVAGRDPRLPILEKSERSTTGTPSRLFRLSAVSSDIGSEDRATKERSKSTYSKRNFVPRYAFLRDGDTSNFLPESRRD